MQIYYINLAKAIMNSKFLSKCIWIFVFSILLNNHLFGQTYNVVVILNDNSTVKGELLELTPDSVAVIEEETGKYLILKGSEISTVYIRGLNKSINFPISKVPNIFKKENNEKKGVPSTQPTPYTQNTQYKPTTRSTPFSQHKKVELYIGGGLSFPMTKEFSDYWNMGFSAGGGIGYRFSPNISGNGYLSYNSFGINKDKFLVGAPSGSDISGGSVSIILVTANIKVLLIADPTQVSPYLLGGAGLFSISISDFTFSYLGQQSTSPVSDSESAFGIVFGGGVDIPASSTLKVVLEVGYTIGFTKGSSTEYLPLKGGIIFLL